MNVYNYFLTSRILIRFLQIECLLENKFFPEQNIRLVMNYRQLVLVDENLKKGTFGTTQQHIHLFSILSSSQMFFFTKANEICVVDRIIISKVWKRRCCLPGFREAQTINTFLGGCTLYFTFTIDILLLLLKSTPILNIRV